MVEYIFNLSIYKQFLKESKSINWYLFVIALKLGKLFSLVIFTNLKSYLVSLSVNVYNAKYFIMNT